MKPYFFIITSFLLMTGCSSDPIANAVPVYHLEVQQGNIITQDMINQIKPGLSKRQVLYIMGSPLLIDSFHTQRWDYYYSVRGGKVKTKTKHLSLFFVNNKIDKISGDYSPVADYVKIQKHVTVTVPKKEKKLSILESLLSKLGYQEEEDI